MQPLLWWTNSTGSSIVMMWSFRVELASSMIAASVVDLPHPVGPVTRTSPRGSEASFETTLGRPSSWQVTILLGISRKTAAQPYCCWKKLAR